MENKSCMNKMLYDSKIIMINSHLVNGCRTVMKRKDLGNKSFISSSVFGGRYLRVIWV